MTLVSSLKVHHEEEEKVDSSNTTRYRAYNISQVIGDCHTGIHVPESPMDRATGKV